MQERFEFFHNFIFIPLLTTEKKQFFSVIAIDNDPKKIEMAKHNANVYGVSDRIEFIVGDFLQLCQSLKADVVFLSPPWGGPDYMKDEVYDLEKSLLPVAGSRLMAVSQAITLNVAIFLPRNTNTHQVNYTQI